MKTRFAFVATFLMSQLYVSASVADWEYRATPYVWLPTLIADTDIGPNPPVQSETDILDVLDFAFLVTGEAHNGDWGLIGEFNYLDLSNSATYSNGLFSTDTSIEGVMIGAALEKRIHNSENANSDIFIGLRHWSIDGEIAFGRLPTAKRSVDFTDPIIGIKGVHNLSEKWHVGGLVEIGGFGVGSDLQWELIARAGYKISKSTNVVFGYRHLVLDFDDDGLELKAEMTGPFVALDVIWE